MHRSSQAQLSLTFDSDLRHSFNDAKTAHGHAGVVGWLTNAAQLENVPAHWHLILWCQILCVQHPLDVRHGRPHCHTRYVHTATGHDFLTRWWNGEARRHPPDWEEAWGRGEDDKRGQGSQKKEKKRGNKRGRWKWTLLKDILKTKGSTF